ncbi:MAG: hypothetical protein ABJA89_12600 [Lapillicoccus sp.]
MGGQRTGLTARTIGRSAAVVGTAALCSVLMAATPALAADGVARAAGSAAETWYRDYTGFTDDLIVVTDRLKDSHGAVGWIEVKQADGSWNRFPKIYNGKGYNTSVSVRQDVLREGAQVKVVSCLQDGVGGSPYNCGIAYGGGDSAY